MNHLSFISILPTHGIATVISFEDTFSDLVEIILESDNAASLPDFWCRRNDVSKNQVTESAAWWECQAARTRVADAIMNRKPGENRNSGNETRESRNVDIRSVITEGEYLVVLVAKGGAENGFPVGRPVSFLRRLVILITDNL